MKFNLQSSYKPTGDQPRAIEDLTRWVREGQDHQTLLGVTGSGKTFTMANVIQNVQKPTLIISHNKTLAGQLYQEFRDFFPDNAVSYFVSYYDYYQPEAYIPTTDTYIEKEATINDEIDKLRLASTSNLLTRPDCIVIASVSCIYNLGSPLEYAKHRFELIEGEVLPRETLLLRLVGLQYERNDVELIRGSFRVRGEVIQLWPANQDYALKIVYLGNQIEKIEEIDGITGEKVSSGSLERSESPERSESSDPNNNPFASKPKVFVIFPAKQYMTSEESQVEGMKAIEKDLEIRLKYLRDQGKIVEAYRLEQKVNYDLDMIRELGFVNGIENYSIYFDGRKPGDPPYTLLDYMNYNAKEFGDGSYLTIIDESHMTLPQIRGMYAGDQSRKETLIKYGFRLPSAMDNRPYQFQEFLKNSKQFLHVSATPEKWEVEHSEDRVTEQLIRPTGLVDPDIEIRPSEGQIPDLMKEILKRKQKGQRVLVTTLTKRMSEVLTEYLNDEKNMKKALEQVFTAEGQDNVEVILREEDKLKVAYLHSDVDTLDRSDILDDLRRGTYDVLVGINLLREGLDLPEVTLVAILDADKAGFLRSRTALIQTMGRAARHVEGHVILYADQRSKAMNEAIEEVERRRLIQSEFNEANDITALTISKPIRDQLVKRVKEEGDNPYTTNKGSAFTRLSNALNKEGLRNEKGELRKKAVVIELSKKEAIDLNDLDPEALLPEQKKQMAKKLRGAMRKAADAMDFELAAMIRDKVKQIEGS